MRLYLKPLARNIKSGLIGYFYGAWADSWVRVVTSALSTQPAASSNQNHIACRPAAAEGYTSKAIASLERHCLCSNTCFFSTGGYSQRILTLGYAYEAGAA